MSEPRGRGRPPLKTYAPHPVVQALRVERQRRGLSTRALAPRVGYHGDVLARWERGETAPTLRMLADWAQTLGLAVVLVRPRRTR